ncbi:MAG: GntR family transcriptional regulator, partial [Acidobacteria bacterium]|nr:GntR family transcriptional regulator [Acidobacteriota bacterium]
EIATSRTPVREAINKLIAEGFVDYMPRRGLFTISIKQAEITELLDIREALETLAIDRCVERITPERIRTLENILGKIEGEMDAGDYLSCNELDGRFHLEIARISGNKKLLGFCRSIEDYMKIARAVEKQTHTKEKNECALKEHRLILNCIKRKDRTGAKKAMHDNIMSMRTNLGV